ncbi:hypothetical protein D9M72_641510 [compost metagenome]
MGAGEHNDIRAFSVFFDKARRDLLNNQRLIDFFATNMGFGDCSKPVCADQSHMTLRGK